MITQNFIIEYELSLLKAYNRASKSKPLTGGLGGNFVESAKSRDEFVREFGTAFRTNSAVLLREIEKGGYTKPQEYLEKVARDVETKLQQHLYRKENKLDIVGFERLARTWKTEVRTVFYDKYLKA